MITYGQRVVTVSGPGVVYTIDDRTGYAGIILDTNAHLNNPPIFWATLEELS